ncbi:MAG: response regulator [Tetragenococcus halophilus]|nr:response regulator [Tetragenococcus halophilus]
MEELHIAIVDDEKIQLDSMRALIKQSAEELELIVHLSIFSSGEQFLFELEDYSNLDLVFLDIEMNQIDGLAVAQKMREKDSEMTNVFATVFAEYAVQGYEVQARSTTFSVNYSAFKRFESNDFSHSRYYSTRHDARICS